MQFDVTIEIPKGQRNKYEIDHKTQPMQELIACAKGWLFPKMG